MITATIFEAKTKLSELLKQVQAGETVVITSGRKKTPVAKLEALTPKKPRRLGLLAGLNLRVSDSFWDPLPEEELRLWNEGGDDEGGAKDPLSKGEKH